MRTKNSIKNIYISILTQIIITLLGFVSRKVFLDSLGITYPQYLVLMVLWEAVKIPEELIKRLSDSELKIEDLVKLKENLNSIISFLSK